MAERAADILEKWRRNIPPEVPKDDVEKVVRQYFDGHFRVSPGGSHFLIIEDDDLHRLETMGYSTGLTGGTLTVPHTGGKYVKRVYVRKIVDAITTKEEFKRIQEGKHSGKE